MAAVLGGQTVNSFAADAVAAGERRAAKAAAAAAAKKKKTASHSEYNKHSKAAAAAAAAAASGAANGSGSPPLSKVVNKRKSPDTADSVDTHLFGENDEERAAAKAAIEEIR